MSTIQMSKTFIPQNTHKSLSTVANVWEKFVGTGELIDTHLRPIIADRWLRCRDLGINPLRNRARSVISNEELDEKLYTDNLCISGKNILDRMANTVKDTGHVVVLADRSGRIIYSVGHHQVQRSLEKINFRPGSEWNEDFVGPNGVGTPLSLGHPELVLGSEHFCQAWQPWVCYGAPIHNPVNHSVVGCIDITGPANTVCIEAMALAISITQTIESDLSVLQLQRREELRLKYRDFQIKWPNNASLAIDDHGYIIDINAKAYSFLDNSEKMMTQSVNTFFPELTPFIQQCLKEGIEREIEMEMKQLFSEHVRILIKPSKLKNDTIGCFVMFINDINPSIPTSLQSNEDELIRRALVKADGNISKAARILNINRTTIYRRRKNWNMND